MIGVPSGLMSSVVKGTTHADLDMALKGGGIITTHLPMHSRARGRARFRARGGGAKRGKCRHPPLAREYLRSSLWTAVAALSLVTIPSWSQTPERDTRETMADRRVIPTGEFYDSFAEIEKFGSSGRGVPGPAAAHAVLS